ncbi:hypothetical protein B0H13DRAFT_2279914 [Mycena leptocephala]|nr:hypothetical protein B0H13DRAFT_2279914 [Mycena leptocephala]
MLSTRRSAALLAAQRLARERQTPSISTETRTAMASAVTAPFSTPPTHPAWRATPPKARVMQNGVLDENKIPSSVGDAAHSPTTASKKKRSSASRSVPSRHTASVRPSPARGRRSTPHLVPGRKRLHTRCQKHRGVIVQGRARMLAPSARGPLIVRTRARRDTADEGSAALHRVFLDTGVGGAGTEERRYLVSRMKGISRGRERKREKKVEIVEGRNPKKEMKARFAGAPSSAGDAPLSAASKKPK